MLDFPVIAERPFMFVSAQALLPTGQTTTLCALEDGPVLSPPLYPEPNTCFKALFHSHHLLLIENCGSD